MEEVRACIKYKAAVYLFQLPSEFTDNYKAYSVLKSKKR